MKNVRLKWIDTLKMIGAGGVFLCHFLSGFSYESRPNAVDFLLSGIANGEFWVCVFCVLSGYLLSKKRVQSIKELIQVVVARYFRFMLPLLFINTAVWVITKIDGFYSAQLGQALGNGFLASSFTSSYDILDVLKYSLVMSKQMNRVFWVIRHMFAASCLIYSVNYLETKIDNNRIVFLIRVVANCVCLMTPYTFFIGVCLLGGWLDLERNRLRVPRSVSDILLVFAIAMQFAVQDILASLLLIEGIVMNQYWEVLWTFLILYGITKNDSLQGFLNSAPFPEKSNTSMTVYLTHWPLMCSIGAGFMNNFMVRGVDYLTSWMLTLLLVMAVQYLAVILWDKAIEPIIVTLFYK